MQSATTGANSVAIGYAALDANTTTSNAVAIGHNALTASTVSMRLPQLVMKQ